MIHSHLHRQNNDALGANYFNHVCAALPFPLIMPILLSTDPNGDEPYQRSTVIHQTFVHRT